MQKCSCGSNKVRESYHLAASALLSRMSVIDTPQPVSGPSQNLKSFGRRRRTKVVDERTRGEQAAYGELASWLMLGLVCPILWRNWQAALVWD